MNSFEMNVKQIKPDIEQVTVTVNGRERRYPKGKNLLAALLEDDCYVPHYCWHPSLSVAGNCRLCLIEVEGQPKPLVSCNMTCTDGLKIKTEGELVEDCRKGMMEFLLVNHPLDCPICDRGGECMLQRYSMDYGIGAARTTDERRRFEKPRFDPLIDIERNRCIMCTRCVRFMDEIADEHLLAIYGRGNRNYIGTFGDGPVANVFSGNIIDICPVGCLTSKPFRFQARAWELQQVTSTCTLCSAGCPTTAWLRDGRLYRVTPPAGKYNGQYTIDEDTEKFICNEGRFGGYYANGPDRLLKAMKTEGESRSSCSETEAIEAAAKALGAAAEAGAEKVAILAGARATNEEYYLLGRLARSALGTNQIDWRLAWTSPEAAEAVGRALAASDGDLDRLETGDYEAALVIGADLLGQTPVTALKIKEAARRGRTRLAMLGSRRDGWLDKYAASSAIAAPEALAANVAGLAEAFDADHQTPESLQPIVQTIASAETGLLVLGLDLAGGAFNAELVPAALALLERLGPGWRFLPVAQGRNAKGAFACGAQSDRLPGGPIHDPTTRDRMAGIWGEVKAGTDAGPTAPEILRRAAHGEIQTLLLHRADELVNHPQRELIEKAIDATPEVIVIDVFPSWITKKATVLLPGALFFETEGSLTSVDGTLQTLSIGNQPPGEGQEDWRILQTLGEALGWAPGAARIPDLFGEILTAWEPTRRFKFEHLRLENPGGEAPNRPNPIIRKQTRPDFKVHGCVRNGWPGAEKASAAVPTELRLLWTNFINGADHLGSRSDVFDALRPDRVIELNPADAAKLDLKSGDRVRISPCRNTVGVALNDSLPPGVAYGACNALDLRIEADSAGLPPIEISRVEKED